MAYEDRYKANMAESVHNVIMEGREKLTVSGTTDVDSFDENEVIAQTIQGKLVIRGDGLRLEMLSLDTGEIIVCGRVDCLEYENDGPQESTGFFARLFR